MPSVLITRPLLAAEPLAIELQRLGYKAVIEPLLSIVPIFSPRPETNAFAAVIITSGNAPAALENRRTEVSGLLDLPCFCVGSRTAEKARSFGFCHIHNAAGDGVELAKLIESKLGERNDPLLHICGHDTDSKVRWKLEKDGYQIAEWPVYEAVPAAAFTSTTRELLEKRRLDAVAVFSPRTAQTLAVLLAESTLGACCAELDAICLSEAIAGILRPLGWRRLIAAPRPMEDAVISCLQDACPVTS